MQVDATRLHNTLERQQGYTQVKREQWGTISKVKAEKDYLIRREVIIKTDCLPILGMLSRFVTPDLSMLRWIAYIKSLNVELWHISEKDNTVANMLSRARYNNEDDMVSEGEEVNVTSLCRLD